MKLPVRKMALIVFVVVCLVLAKNILASKLTNYSFEKNGLYHLDKIAGIASAITFHKIPLIESVKYCSKVAEIRDEIIGSKSPDVEVIPFRLKSINEILIKNENILTNCLNNASKSRTIKKILPDEISTILPNLTAFFPDFKTILNNFATQDQKWLILFQNSDEIRATGGFTGSYALATITDGNISELVFEDIYDADGQFKGYVEPPDGVKKFLSSNNGLRLPDANWHPDNIKSVQQQLDFFALGQKQNIDGVAVINLPFAENLLKITGPVEIPDYDVIVSGQNLNQALRDERSEFFAGSIQKKHILSQVVKQTLFKLDNLSTDKYLETIKLIQTGIKNKEIMFYSQSQPLSQVIEKYQASGSINPAKAKYFLGLVESNVGINKANRNVARSVEIELNDNRSKITINFANNNLPPQIPPDIGAKNNGYVNYQRFLVAPEWQVHSVSINGKNIERRDEELIKTSTDAQLKQIGLLITVAEQQKNTLTIEFTHPPLVYPNSLQIYKQPGLAPVPYLVSFNGHQKHLLLESDQIVMLE